MASSSRTGVTGVVMDRSARASGEAGAGFEILEGVARECDAAEPRRMMGMIGVEIRPPGHPETEIARGRFVMGGGRRVVIAVPHFDRCQAIRGEAGNRLVHPHEP